MRSHIFDREFRLLKNLRVGNFFTIFVWQHSLTLEACFPILTAQTVNISKEILNSTDGPVDRFQTSLILGSVMISEISPKPSTFYFHKSRVQLAERSTQEDVL